MREYPVIKGHFIQMVSYLPNVKEPQMKGHLRGPPSDIQRHFMQDSVVSLGDRFHCSSLRNGASVVIFTSAG